MPIPMPPGALPAAHQVICLRSVRAIARRHFNITFSFKSAGSKKCAYCTLQNKKCKPVPKYAGPEYKDMWQAIKDLTETVGLVNREDNEEGQAAAESARVLVRSRALRLANYVQVATAQFKDLQPIEVLLASHYAIVGEIRGLREEVSGLREEIVALATVLSERTAPAPPSRAAGQGGSGGRGGRGGLGSALVSADGLGGGLAASDSELSDPPKDMELQ